MAASGDFEHLRRRLEKKRRSLVQGIEEQAEEQLMEDNPDAVDLADLTTQQIVQSRLDQLSEDVLERIEKALNRMEAGTYGDCVKCGRAISPERLLALPYVELCVKCQRRLEDQRP